MGSCGSGDMLHLIAGPLLIEVGAGVEEGDHLIRGHFDLQEKADQGKTRTVGQVHTSCDLGEHLLDAGRKGSFFHCSQVHLLAGPQCFQLLAEGFQVFFKSLAYLLVHRDGQTFQDLLPDYLLQNTFQLNLRHREIAVD